MRQKIDLIIGRKYYLDVELEITAVPSPNLERQQHRSSFSFYYGEGVSKFVADLLRRNLAAKCCIEGYLSGRLVRPGRASTFLLDKYLSSLFNYRNELFICFAVDLLKLPDRLSENDILRYIIEVFAILAQGPVVSFAEFSEILFVRFIVDIYLPFSTNIL
ncbi:MAG: hypothetical protein IKI13_06000 [Bacteroidales bacterium]|nr:hypothetical protein [Bacteroidales bacterium]